MDLLFLARIVVCRLGCTDADEVHKDTKAPRPCVGRSRSRWQAPQASRRSWSCTSLHARHKARHSLLTGVGLRVQAGGQHHHRTNFDKYHPGYFGKVGMRYFHKTKNQFWCPVVNVDKLHTLIPAEQKDGLSSDSTVLPVVDTLKAGYGKVLAKGRLPAYPMIVKARYVSREAENKIRAQGGAVVLVA